jgi:hypothetical protein
MPKQGCQMVFFRPQIPIWEIFGDVGIFCGHSVNFPAIWYILRPFGAFCGHLVYVSHVGTLYQEESGNPVA